MGKTQLHSIVAVLFCLLLTIACNKDAAGSRKEQRSEAEPASVPDAPAPLSKGDAADSRPVIVAFGDSLTAGVSGRSYPDALQDLLDHNGYLYRVQNQGVSGDTTSDGLARIDNVIAAKPVLVLLEFGGNDGLRGIPVESTRDNLNQMIERIQQTQIPLVLLGITLPPNYGPDYVRPFTALFPDLAAQHHIKLMPFLLLHVYQNRALMQPDGIHPNEEGNKIVAHDVLALIAPLLKRTK